MVSIIIITIIIWRPPQLLPTSDFHLEMFQHYPLLLLKQIRVGTSFNLGHLRQPHPGLLETLFHGLVKRFVLINLASHHSSQSERKRFWKSTEAKPTTQSDDSRTEPSEENQNGISNVNKPKFLHFFWVHFDFTNYLHSITVIITSLA